MSDNERIDALNSRLTEILTLLTTERAPDGDMIRLEERQGVLTKRVDKIEPKVEALTTARSEGAAPRTLATWVARAAVVVITGAILTGMLWLVQHG